MKKNMTPKEELEFVKETFFSMDFDKPLPPAPRNSMRLKSVKKGKVRQWIVIVRVDGEDNGFTFADFKRIIKERKTRGRK